MVSIIVPVYNVESYLKPCLDSLIHQRNRNVEIIAVNDGSTDHSATILQNYAVLDARVTVIHQTNKGLSGARNTGLLHAKGDYIIFVDSDDVVDKTLVERCVYSFDTHKSDLVIFNHAVFNDGSKQIQQQRKELSSGLMNTASFLKCTLHLATHTWNPVWLYAYKKSFLDTYNLRFYEGILHEDILFTPQALSYANSITVVPDVLYFYRKRAGSITTDPIKAEQSLKDYYFIAEELYQFGSKIKPQEKKAVFFTLLRKRYQFVIEACLRSDSHNSDIVYKKAVTSLRKKKPVSQLFKTDFYRQHIESKAAKQLRILKEKVFKWPRRIYKYKIKPLLS